MTKIRKITFIDHPVLGNLTLDFCDVNGNAVDTVIFAGENGSGKSTILSTIYSVTSMESVYSKYELILELETEIGIITYTIKKTESNSWIRNFSKPYSKKLLGIFSDVDINFHSRFINSVTSQNVDVKSESRRSNTNLPEEINQLLIDVQALDDSAFVRAYDTAKINNQDTNNLVFSRRMTRFKNAFSKMFDNMIYDRIENQNGHKSIMFKKNGKEFPIESLSSGEKQIVYRGCFLLKDANALNGAFVFIDEPEISLHPNWQKKIMDYYKGIFTDENGNQTSQIFAVTHSPFIIHNENRRNDKVIVIERDSQGIIVVKDKPEYYKCDSLELVHDAFLIKDFSLGQPTVYLEGRTDEKYFTKALEVFGYSNIPFRFKWIGYIDDNGQERFTGDKSLNQAFDFLVSKNLPYKNVLLYDCDTNKPKINKNNVITLCMQDFENHRGFTIGVENALILDESFEVDKYKKTTEKIDDYGCKNIIQKLDKMSLCNYICGLEDEKLRSVFANLKTEIDILIELFNGDL